MVRFVKNRRKKDKKNKYVSPPTGLYVITNQPYLGEGIIFLFNNFMPSSTVQSIIIYMCGVQKTRTISKRAGNVKIIIIIATAPLQNA